MEMYSLDNLVSQTLLLFKEDKELNELLKIYGIKFEDLKNSIVQLVRYIDSHNFKSYYDIAEGIYNQFIDVLNDKEIEGDIKYYNKQYLATISLYASLIFVLSNKISMLLNRTSNENIKECKIIKKYILNAPEGFLFDYKDKKQIESMRKYLDNMINDIIEIDRALKEINKK